MPTAMALALSAISLGACGYMPAELAAPRVRLTERECMARVMYFESDRSSDEGMLGVGTVVMNRLQSPKYPKSVCEAVGQPKQFADGALTKAVNERSPSWAKALRMADAVLSGDRHPGVGRAEFFHTAGYTFPYRNMHYVALAGGNAFYEKRAPGTFTPGMPLEGGTMLAQAKEIAQRPKGIAADEARDPKPKATVLASTAERNSSQNRGAPDVTKPKSMVAAAGQGATKPRPIVLAMLPPRRSAQAPRSITDLIEVDARQTY
jgi:spore germination cell wall hydrolase CwlJ-like protein